MSRSRKLSSWIAFASLVVVCVLAVVTAGVRERLEATRRETLRALADSERQYRLLTENSSDVVYLVGPDRRATWVSPNVSETLGLDRGGITGLRKMYDLIHVDDRARIDVLREAVFAGPGHHQSRGRLADALAAQGRHLHVDVAEDHDVSRRRWPTGLCRDRHA